MLQIQSKPKITRARMYPADLHQLLTATVKELKNCNDADVISDVVHRVASDLISYDRLAELPRRSIILVEQQCYHNIKARCYNTTYKQYHNYGGRGIRMCDLWLSSFWFFYRDMGPRPLGDGTRTGEYSIERIDNNLNYSSDNCKWATRMEQQSNLTTNVHHYRGPDRQYKIWLFDRIRAYAARSGVAFPFSDVEELSKAVGVRPSKDHALKRIVPSIGYAADNLHWVLPKTRK